MENGRNINLKNGISKRKAAANASLNIAKRNSSSLKRVQALLRRKKKNSKLTEEDKKFLNTHGDLVKQFYKRREKRAELLKRQDEHEDSPKEIEEKCLKLAQAIHDAEFLVVYTGAGISTAANIPDYRGPNGIWTRLQKGKDIGSHDLTTAEPTLTHMALSYLHKKGIVRHIVSQNCDGLHLRSGLPKTSLSEVHGNMYIEVCKHCAPAREYVRIFDVTEKTSKFKHTTGRRCYRCGEPLIDSIVHFGERGKLRWPLNWQGACQAANASDTILCIGSSLKVLKKYPWLWQMDRPQKKRPQLFVINLQWTPKDKEAAIKINGKCDEIMKLVMDNLGFETPLYQKDEDPIFQIYTDLHEDEKHTVSGPFIDLPRSRSTSPESGTETPFKEENVTGEPEEDQKTPLIKDDHSESVIRPDHSGFIPKTESTLEAKAEFKVENCKSECQREIKSEEMTDSGPCLKTVVKQEEIKTEDIKQEIKNEDQKLVVLGQLENGCEEKLVSDQRSDTFEKNTQAISEFVNSDLVHSKTTDISSISKEMDFGMREVANAKEEKCSNTPSGPPAIPDPSANIEENTPVESEFYGTGLCIRSRSPSLLQISSEDDALENTSCSSLYSDYKSEIVTEHHATDYVDDFEISSHSETPLSCQEEETNSLPSSENLSTHCQVHPENLTSSGVLVHSSEAENAGRSHTIEILEISNTHDLNENGVALIESEASDSNSVYPGSASPQNGSEVVFGECFSAMEIDASENVILSPELFFDLSESGAVLLSKYQNFRKEDGFLLESEVVDGIICRDVKPLKNGINGERVNGKHNLLTESSDPELKALWYEKFCDSSHDRKIEKTQCSRVINSKPELDDDVKRLWFWGFESKPPEKPKRLTRSSYHKALKDKKASGIVSCKCLASNADLCKSTRAKKRQPLDYEMKKARLSVRKRRQFNYRPFEPVFELELESITYERKTNRKPKREEYDDEEDEEEGEDDIEIDEEPEAETIEEESTSECKKKAPEIKVIPGWYGKGYRKLLRKRRNCP